MKILLLWCLIGLTNMIFANTLTPISQQRSIDANAVQYQSGLIKNQRNLDSHHSSLRTLRDMQLFRLQTQIRRH